MLFFDLQKETALCQYSDVRHGIRAANTNDNRVVCRLSSGAYNQPIHGFA
jgi:hypothetical protein